MLAGIRNKTVDIIMKIIHPSLRNDWKYVSFYFGEWITKKDWEQWMERNKE
jgi:hypothetical protein